MQKLAIALALAVSVALGGLSPSAVPAASAASGARIVIIVGATHSATPGYRVDANSAYAEAIKWTPNVTRVMRCSISASGCYSVGWEHGRRGRTRSPAGLPEEPQVHRRVVARLPPRGALTIILCSYLW